MVEALFVPISYLGSTIYWVLGSMVLLSLVALPTIRALAMLVSTTGWLTRLLARWLRPVKPVVDPTRPLTLDGLTPALGKLARDTRTLALELRRRSELARHWPDDAADVEQASAGLGGLRSFIFSDLGDFTPLMDTRREVYDWLGSVERLAERDRAQLQGLGVDPEQVRRALIESMRGGRQAADGIRELAGLLWSIDERLAAGSTAGYRTNGSYGASQLQGRGLPAPGLAKEPVVEPSAAPGAAIFVEDDELDEDRERQLAAVLREHGSSISRMAASYGRHSAEREDLEQDIALALWRALPSFRGESSLKTFVHRVARYACFRHLRRRRPGAESVDDTPLSDPDTCPEAALLHEDDRARMEQALADLPRTLESTLSLHLRGFSYAEIAEALGITERNVSVRLTRARKQLRRQLA